MKILAKRKILINNILIFPLLFLAKNIKDYITFKNGLKLIRTEFFLLKPIINRNIRIIFF